MTSLRIENTHKMLLDKLLYDSGLDCIRSMEESPGTTSESEEMELKGIVYITSLLFEGHGKAFGWGWQEETVVPEVEHLEEAVGEETRTPSIELSTESVPHIFPTPSLRKILPDSVRAIQEYNKVHVLPEEFRTDIDPTMIPKIENTPQQKYIDILGDITGCKDYKKSLAEFWFLDTLANLLRRSQSDNLSRLSRQSAALSSATQHPMSPELDGKWGTVCLNTRFPLQYSAVCGIGAVQVLPSQAILILWFCEWMKEIQHFDAADRRRMMKRFEENMVKAAIFVEEENYLPTPAQVQIFYKSEEEIKKSVSQTTPKSKQLVTFEHVAYECSMLDLTCILHYIFDLFSSDYQFELVRSIFTFTPDYTLIDGPFQMRQPKQMWAPLKPKSKKEKSPKKEKPTGKGKKKEPDNEEYLALMEFRARDEKEQEEKEEKDRDAWNLRSHILPLTLAADGNFLNKYWPPPPPEPEPIEEDIKGKKKDKKKK